MPKHRGRQPRQQASQPDEASSSIHFEEYYRSLGLLPENEWPAFLETMRADLPTTFRVTKSRSNAQDLNDIIKRIYCPFLSNVIHEGQKLSPPHQLEWYPDGYAWQIDVGKKHIRKSSEFRKFQDFLVYETEAGNISRQEAVSMIPPLLLDVKPHHYVLDMCAAPGSKSAQILEDLHTPHDIEPTGLFVANDSDAKRCHMLVHQSLTRIGSPNMMVTNQDASIYGALKQQSDDPASTALKQVKFDRILCDVPCSGDGTLRKNIAIWTKWRPSQAIGLHPLQSRILQRGLQLLKPGGRLVYSTCSLNPVENEAIISSVLDTTSDVKLVDMSDALPDLKRRPGLTDWKVLNMSGEVLPKPDADEVVRGSNGRELPHSIWPNGKEAERNLQHCFRLYPHDQNTGGFFVAVLEKAVSPARSGKSQSDRPQLNGQTQTHVNGAGDNEERPAKRQRTESKSEEPAATVADIVDEDVKAQAVEAVETTTGDFREDPYTYLSADNADVQQCLNFFDIKPEFDTSNMLVRNKDGIPLRAVYITSRSVRNVVQANDYQRMRLVSCGVKALIRQDSGKTETYACRWRVFADAIHFMQRYIGDRKFIIGNKQDLRILMEQLYPATPTLMEPFKELVQAQDLGSCFFVLKPDGTDESIKHDMVLPLWKAPNSVSLMVDKLDKSALSMRLFGTDLTPHAKVKTAKKTLPDAVAGSADDKDEPKVL